MSQVHKKETQILSMDSNDKNTEKFALAVKEIIHSSDYKKEDIVFLCIGSDRSVGDSLGPLIGTMLKEHKVPYQVYGTLESPVHAYNLQDTIKGINKRFKKKIIFGIDACLGEQNQVGHVFLGKGPLVPGKALNRDLPQVGDYHILGIVNSLGPMPTTRFLNDTRLYTVMHLAKTIVNIIVRSADG